MRGLMRRHTAMLVLLVATAGHAQTLEECLRQRAQQFTREETFSVSGRVRCEGAGVSGKGQKRTETITYEAAPGRRILGDPVTEVVSNNRGRLLPIKRSRVGDRDVVSVPIECISPDRAFGPGAWLEVRVNGKVEAPPTGDDYLRFARECEAARRDR